MKAAKRSRKAPRLYWALVTKGGQFFPEHGKPTQPWLNEVWGTVPPMPPPGYERVQVELVVRRRGL